MGPICDAMLLITDLNDIPTLKEPCGLTIGTFDGVHLGHQTLLKHLRSKKAIFTFSNSPSNALLIYPPLQKVKYLFDCGADLVIMIPFSHASASIPYDQFLQQMKERLGFSHLVLGAGATFGSKRQGNEENVKKLSKKLHFEVEYLAKYKSISSGYIRNLITHGAFEEASACLGRPYSLMGRMQKDTLPLPGICLPPKGDYPVQVKTSDKKLSAHAQVLPASIRLDIKLDTDVEIIFNRPQVQQRDK
jgi:riboflavin kinase / FMN adenylyltransferase